VTIRHFFELVCADAVHVFPILWIWSVASVGPVFLRSSRPPLTIIFMAVVPFGGRALAGIAFLGRVIAKIAGVKVRLF
jgi:hypothetical protein